LDKGTLAKYKELIESGERLFLFFHPNQKFLSFELKFWNYFMRSFSIPKARKFLLLTSH